jgi:hypothetical protein
MVPSSQGNTGRKLGELRGHTSSVTSIALDESLNQVVGRRGQGLPALAPGLGSHLSCRQFWSGGAACSRNGPHAPRRELPAPLLAPRPQFTMAADKTVKVWDLRNHKCMQTITEVRGWGGARHCPASHACAKPALCAYCKRWAYAAPTAPNRAG